MNDNLKPLVVPTIVGVASGALGFAAGWFVHSRRYAETIQVASDILDDEVAYEVEDGAGNSTVVTIDEIKAKRQRATMEEHPSAEPPEVLTDIQEAQGFKIAAEEYENIVLNPRRDPSEIEHGIPEEAEGNEPVVENVWDEVDTSVPDWDWDAEKKHREAIPHDTPYILHRDEFFDEETHYGQTTLTYYAGDKKLTDERDAPLYNMGDIVGDCLRFGHGSGDPTVVYIRNNKLHAEYEVLLHEGKYDVEILGMDAEKELENELKHSEHRVLKFRDV